MTILIIPIDHNNDPVIHRKPSCISSKPRLKFVEKIGFALKWVDLEGTFSEQQAVQEFA